MKSLFKLIKSLHPTEKRYVNLKLQSSRNNSLLHNYFQTIQDYNEYDFDALQEKYKETSSKVLKNSLRNLYLIILKHLRSYNAPSDNEGYLADMLKDVKNLQEKSMLFEAGKLNAKLLKHAQTLEYFFYEKEALLKSWDLCHLKGELTQTFTEEIEHALEEVTVRENEVNTIDSKYRQAVTLYYQYFFYERKEETKELLLKLTSSSLIADVDALKSSKAKMSSFEIQAMGAIIQVDMEGHHNVRKRQLKLLVTAEVFKKNYLSQLLVFSNLFTFLIAKVAIDVVKSYLGYMKRYYLPLIEKNTDGVLTEKYYDIYFRTNIYLQYWYLDKPVINQLLEEFKTVSKKEFRRNNLLVSRVYLLFAQLLILSGDFKHALLHLIDYQSLSLDKKNSSYFVDSELHLLMVYHLMGKQDVFDKNVETIKRKERIEAIVFTPDQKLLFDAFFAIYDDQKFKGVTYNGKEGWLKVYLDVLSKKPLKEAVHKQFNKDNFIDLPEERKFLQWLDQL